MPLSGAFSVRIYQLLTLLGLIAVVGFIGANDLPRSAQIVCFIAIIVGFFSAVLWAWRLTTWRVLLPLILSVTLLLPAWLSVIALHTNYCLDAIRDKILQQLAIDGATVRQSNYDLFALANE
jgi:hypothetical protein